jgi:hypothetical protein
MFFMATLFSYLKSIQNLKVPYFFFTKRNPPQGDTLGRIFSFFNNSSSCICNSFSSGVPILYGVLETGVALATKSIKKSMSLFGGNHGISIKTSSKSLKIGWFSILFTLSLAASSICAAKIQHPFMKLFFNCIAGISLTTTTLGMP